MAEPPGAAAEDSWAKVGPFAGAGAGPLGTAKCAPGAGGGAGPRAKGRGGQEALRGRCGLPAVRAGAPRRGAGGRGPAAPARLTPLPAPAPRQVDAAYSDSGLDSGRCRPRGHPPRSQQPPDAAGRWQQPPGDAPAPSRPAPALPSRCPAPRSALRGQRQEGQHRVAGQQHRLHQRLLGPQHRWARGVCPLRPRCPAGLRLCPRCPGRAPTLGGGERRGGVVVSSSVWAGQVSPSSCSALANRDGVGWPS